MSEQVGPQLIAPWGTQFSFPYPYEFRTEVVPVGYVSKWSSSSAKRASVYKKRPVNGTSSRMPNGFRPPTALMATTCVQVSGRSFDYLSQTAGAAAGTYVRIRGNSGFTRSTEHLYCGCDSGASRGPIIIPGMRERAVTECLNKIANSDMNASESLATVNQTLSMLLSAIKNLLEFLKNALKLLRGKPVALINQVKRLSATRKGRRKLGKLLGKGLSSRWLEYQYGWKPLMSDIYHIYEEIQKFDSEKPLKLKAVRNCRTGVDLPAFPPLAPGCISTVEGSIHAGVKVRMDVRVNNPVLYTLNQYGITNPMLLAWELTPFSFVVDWVVPFGAWLSALTAGYGVTWMGGSVTHYSVADVGFSWTQHRFVSGTSNNVSVKSMAMQRVSLPAQPLPYLYMKNPFTSLTRLATMLALLQQLKK